MSAYLDINTTPSEFSVQRSALLLLGVLLFIGGGIGSTGYAYYQQQKSNAVKTVREHISAIADLKAEEIDRWILERRRDAMTLYHSRLGIYLKPSLAERTAPPMHPDTVKWLSELAQSYGYYLLTLLDAEGEAVLSFPSTAITRHEQRRTFIEKALSTREVIFSGLQGDEMPYLDIAVPLLSDAGKAGPAIGALFLHVNPNDSLFPQIRKWPISNSTAEVLLVRRQGDEVVILNNLENDSSTMSAKHFPLHTANLVSAIVARDEADRLETDDGMPLVDYRGVPALATTRSIPDSPWRLIVKIDSEKIYAQAWTETVTTVLIMGLLLLVGSLLIWAAWRYHTETVLRQGKQDQEALVSERTKELELINATLNAEFNERQKITEERNRFLQMSSDLFAISDLSGYFKPLNPAWEYILGYSADELQANSIFELVHPDDLPSMQEATQQLASGKMVIGFEHRCRCRNGDYKWLQWNVIPNIENNLIYCSGRDITERKHAEQKLLRMKDLYAALAQTNEAIIHCKNRTALFGEICRIAVEHGRFKMAWIGMLDAESPQILPAASYGQKQDYLEDIVISMNAHVPEGRCPAGKAVRNGDYYVENDFLNDPDAAPWREKIAQANFRSVGAFALKQEGTIIGILTVYAEEPGFFDQELIKLLQEMALDVSHALDNLLLEAQRHEAVAKLEQTQVRLRYVLDISPVGVFALDVDLSNPESPYRLTFISKTIEAMIGYEASEWGENPWKFWLRHLHPNDLSIAERRADLFERGHVTHDYRFRHKNGAYRWIHSHAVLIRDSGGAPKEIIGAWLDITEYKYAQEQLHGAQKMEIIGRLTGGIAHDFNNMLAVMLNCLQLLQRRIQDDEKAEKYVRMALDSAQRGRDITRNLLAFSRRQVLDPSVLDPNKIILYLAPMLRQAVGESIDLSLSLAERVWFAKLDQAQLESALLNLCINARDAMPDGGKLSIQTANTYLDNTFTAQHPWKVETGPYAMISVSDTGVGISPEIQAKIFDPFFTTKESGKGTGLGLSMVYGFVKQSGGHITFYSEEGFGTSFKLYFPKADGKAPEAAPAEAAELPTGQETILVVEDDPSVREIHAMLIEELGYKVLKAENGPQALEIIEQRSDIDLLFSDVVMPGGMSGLRLAQQAHERSPQLKILLVSGYPTDIIEAQQKNNGAPIGQYDLLMKPFTKDTVAFKIRQILDRAN